MAADQSVLEVWSIAIESLVRDTNALCNQIILAKKRADDILDLRNLVAEMFEAVEDELRYNGVRETMSGHTKEDCRPGWI